MMRVSWYPEEYEYARPAENITRSEWCRRNMVLTEKSAIRGPYDLRQTPYWIWPIDELLSDRSVKVITICASAQIGKSFLTYAIALNAADQEKKSSLIVLSDQATAEKVNETRLQTLIEKSESLSKLKKKFTMSELQLMNGASISIAWASSVAKLATFEFPVIILDEVDKPGYYSKSDEADAIKLAFERTATFHDRKIILISTPSIESGNIWKHLEGVYDPESNSMQGGADIIYDFHVPCPYCGQMQPLRFDREDHAFGFKDGKFRSINGEYLTLGRVTWEGGRKATREQILKAGYECGICGRLWNTMQKNGAVDHGKWVPRQEINYKPQKVGLHLWRLYSKLGNSGDIQEIVGDWISSVKSRDQKVIQGVINSTFAGPFRFATQDRKESAIFALCDDRPRGLVPNEGVLGITAGIDTQDNGFYYVVRAWGEFDESWLITEGFIDDFDVLIQIISGRFKNAKSDQFIVNFAFQDAMGHRTAEVYEKLRLIPQIKPTKGEQRMASPFSITKIDTYPGTNKPIPGGLSLYRINSTYYKNKLHAKLLIPSADQGAFHMHSEISEDYARHMVAEFRNEMEIWECPNGRPNHYWDCEVLAMAAADILGVKYWGKEVQEVEQKPKTQPSRPQRRRSRW